MYYPLFSSLNTGRGMEGLRRIRWLARNTGHMMDFAFPNLLVVTIYNRSQLIQDLDEDAYKFINCI